MSKVLVTGGAGFVGSHLCDRLLAEGHDVTVLDNLSTGSRDNVAHLLEHPRFRLVIGDVCDPFDFDVDRIFNLACPASPVHYQADPIKTLATSVDGVRQGIALAVRRGARFLQASTSEVYGDPEIHPQPERYWGRVNPIGPRACYDEGKRCAETLCFDYHRLGKLDLRVVRIFNTYGPRMAENDGRVVSNFVVQALRGEPLTMYGAGEQTRSFCYVDDLVDGIVRMMDKPEEPGPINLGNDGEFTVAELAKKVIALTGSASTIVSRPMPADDPRVRRPDLTLARERLGYEPKIALDEGLARTIEWFQARVR